MKIQAQKLRLESEFLHQACKRKLKELKGQLFSKAQNSPKYRRQKRILECPYYDDEATPIVPTLGMRL
eukprot:g5725.t1